MAGDWLKVEASTPNKPEIAIIARMMGVSIGDAFLEWFRFYCWLDQQTATGFVPHIVPVEAGHLSRCCPALVQALCHKDVGWIIKEEGGFRIKNWDLHNGKSAKVRSTEARKKKRQRSGHAEASRECPGGNGTSAGLEKSIILSPVPQSLNNPEFVSAWEKWLLHLQHKKGQLPTQQTQDAVLMNLARAGSVKAIKDIQFSILKGAVNIISEAPKSSDRKSEPTTDQPVGTFEQFAAAFGPQKKETHY